jgi:hypothetical protein
MLFVVRAKECHLEAVVATSEIYRAVIPRWREQSWLSRTLRGWFPNWWRPPLGVIVYEYVDGDWDGARCAGDPVRAWRVSPTGPLEIQPSTEIKQSCVGPWYREYSIIRFCVSTDRARIILSHVDGPRAGHGAVYDITVRNGQVVFENPKCQWRS